MKLRSLKTLVLLVPVAAYVVHFAVCADSVLPGMTALFTNSDAFSNLTWAGQILEQGWLNPRPYHPYHNWMQAVGPYEDWVAWWGNPSVFLRSPLFAYLLAFFLKVTGSVIGFHFLQCLLGALLCLLLGGLAMTVFEDHRTGWLALGIATLYAPFYCYAWPLVRDLMSWVILAGSLWLIAVWWKRWAQRPPSPALSLAAGAVLGAGLLARETFYLIVPLAMGIALVRCRIHSRYSPWGWLLAGLILSLSPLVVRNARVGAPLFSTSDRFSEGFVLGNASSAKAGLLVCTEEMKELFRRTDGKPLHVVEATMAAYRDCPGKWLRLQWDKVVAMLDPYESPDNLNYYFMQEISPFVRWGLPHWFVLIPGIGGCLLGIWRRDVRQVPLWLFLFCLSANFAIIPVLSRYRQSLAILWIPWAACFFVALWDLARRRSFRKVLAAGLLLLGGWAACLGPCAVQPRRLRYRPTEYRFAVRICQDAGDVEGARRFAELYERRLESARQRDAAHGRR